jgi:N-hydroxyarylamine O-acetyltransferase
VYRIALEEERRQLQQRDGDGRWASHYQFTLQPRAWSDFAETCRYHQTSPQSSFTQRRICTLATPTGRVTVSDRRLIVTVDGARQETPLADEAAVSAVLRERFGVVI